ncbi:MAG: glycosyltransferase, partial [Chloroflexi bacterium]|nr:glycosyltransferase [Chloroflexota bacterium]
MRVCFIQAQGHMYSGGQGIYLHHITAELSRLGHEVHVIAGVPYPEVVEGVRLHRLKTFSFWGFLDDYEEYVYRTHPLLFFHPVNLYEFATTRLTLSSLLNMFSLRAYQKLNELER